MWTLFVSLGLVVLAIVPLTVRVRLAFDLLDKRVAVKARLLGLVPIRLYLSVQEGQLLLQGKPLSGNKKASKGASFLAPLGKRVLQTLQVKASLHLLLGTGQTYATALVCSALSLWPRSSLTVQAWPNDKEVCKGYLSLRATLRLWQLVS